MRGPGGRRERVSRDLEVVASELYEAQRSERGGRASGCEGLLKEKERQCLEELSKCSNAYRPLLLKSLKLILELWQLAKDYEKGSPALPKEARDSLMAYVIPKARRLFIEITNVLKEKEGFDEISWRRPRAHRAMSPPAAVSPEAAFVRRSVGKDHSCPHSDLANAVLPQNPSRLNPQAVSEHLHAALETRDPSALISGLKEVLSVMKSSLHSDLGLSASQTFKSLKSFAL